MGRMVGYRYGFDSDIEFDESAMERILVRATKLGIVTEYDTGRGRVVWFNGRPGAALRAVRDQVQALIAKGK
jgi:hypothetical protein